MLVGHAKAIARQWVSEEAGNLPGFGGAFFHGSTNWLPDDAALPAASDVDVMVVLSDPHPPLKPGKFRYRDVLLEISYLSSDELRSPEEILGLSHLAGSFAAASVIADPSGHLARLHAAVSSQYAQRRWVLKRCAHARDKILANLQSIRESDHFHDQVTAWLFGTGVTTHVLLVAGLRNPTVRTRYPAVRRLLADYARSDFYEPLLDLLGCAGLTPDEVECHLDAMTDAFDAAKLVIKTPVFFASDISDVSRPIAIDASREMIAAGNHREAVFWIVATYARCLKILHNDAAADLTERHIPGFQSMLADLGISSFADLQRCAERTRGFLPRVWSVAESIVAANPEIQD